MAPSSIIDLSQTGTNTFHVRNLPTYLVGKFEYYTLTIPVPSERDYPQAQTSWKQAEMTVIFRKLDRTDIFYQNLKSSDISPNFYDTRGTWNVEWSLDDRSVGRLFLPFFNPNASFDIIVVVNRPSPRHGDVAIFQGYAYAHEP
jgi:hypothetical protein